MQIKYAVLCYIEYVRQSERSLRDIVEFQCEPTNEQVEEVLANMPIYNSDYEIDYYSGAVLPDYRMPKKCRIKCNYAVVEKRFYGEVDN